jgi:hypothetical protein
MPRQPAASAAVRQTLNSKRLLSQASRAADDRSREKHNRRQQLSRSRQSRRSSTSSAKAGVRKQLQHPHQASQLQSARLLVLVLLLVQLLVLLQSPSLPFT